MRPFWRSAVEVPADGRSKDARIVGEELAAVLPQDGKAFWKKWYLLRLNLILLVPLFTAGTVGYDGAMMNALQIAPYWRIAMGSPNPGQLGLINAIFPIGKICGLAMVTPMADRFGRKLPIIIGAAISVIGSGIQAGAVNYGMFVFSRWFVGIGTAFMSQPSPLLITEVAYPTHRGKLTALFNTFYYFGAIFAAWATYGTVRMTNDWSWRIPSLFQGLLPAIQLAFVYFIPESPRWLIAKGRVQEANDILTRHHGNGDPDSPLVAFEMTEIQETLRIERELKHQATWRDLVATPSNRKRVMLAVACGFFSQWCGNGVVSYYLTLVLNTIGIKNARDQALINGLLQIYNFAISVFLGALMVDKLGRRTLFLWSAFGMMLSYIVWTALSAEFLATKNRSIGIAVVPMIFVFYFHYDIAWTPLVIAYPSEIFPYALRGMGVTITYLSLYCSLIFNLFANPIAMSHIGWKYYIVYCVINGGIFIFIWFMFPETKGHTLEEIARIFDPEDASTARVSSAPSVAEKENVVEAHVNDSGKRQYTQRP